MKRLKSFLIFLGAILLFSSCIKIPQASVDLFNQIEVEIDRTHELNLSLVNELFNSKVDQVDQFIQYQYAPKLLENVISDLEEVGAVDSEIIIASMPIIIEETTKQRNSMQKFLDEQRAAIINQLNKDYMIMKEATTAMNGLIKSSAKINRERERVVQSITDLSGGKIDFTKYEAELDKILFKSGEISKEVEKYAGDANLLIDLFLQK
jgi:hypothetical protein